MICTDRIEKHKFKYFHTILCGTGGRYLQNPIDCGEFFLVQYEPGDYNVQFELWNRLNITIKETKPSKLKLFMNKIIGIFK